MMADIDDEFLRDQEENRKELLFIRQQLPSDLKEKYSDEQLLWMMDAIADYFYDSGILETNSEEVEVDMEQVSDYVCRQAKEAGQPELDASEVQFVVEADLEYQEENA